MVSSVFWIDKVEVFLKNFCRNTQKGKKAAPISDTATPFSIENSKILKFPPMLLEVHWINLDSDFVI